ncbi:Fur family transcriptional regulator [Gloeomargaritales cyanobacterium VI4D9]|nr:Fur family transcriptional regulator [Gloeomargaritales cyanobacterium VI4D9]
MTTDSPGVRSLEAAIRRCQAMGMRLSRQRRSILELLWQSGEHLSAREIYHRLNEQGQAIGHTSVYQNLDALTSQGVIECVERANGRLYGSVSEIHSHVNCLDTQQILDVWVELPPEVIAQVEQETGTKVTAYRVEFFAYRRPESLASGG